MPMSKTQKYSPVFPRPKALALAHKVSRARSEWEAIEAIADAISSLPAEGDWVRVGQAVIDYLKGESDKPAIQIFMPDGNSKLPFYAWSVLPIYMCPGRGECAKHCYSLKSWKNPEAYFRQVQNTILSRFRKDVIRRAFLSIPKGVRVRLFVDGDFDSPRTVRFWFSCLKSRPDLRVYGYSKSWDELWQVRQHWPNNYMLNLSSSGKVRKVTLEQMLSLPRVKVRGRFINVPIPGKLVRVGTKRYALPEYKEAVRSSAQALGFGKVFVCPGKCGGCTDDGPACGSERFADVLIAIGTH